jgi:hypothetical protein
MMANGACTSSPKSTSGCRGHQQIKKACKCCAHLQVFGTLQCGRTRTAAQLLPVNERHVQTLDTAARRGGKVMVSSSHYNQHTVPARTVKAACR